MKRAKLVKYLLDHGCYLIREGKKHTIYYNPRAGDTTAVPRHTEVNDFLAEKICRDLRMPKIKAKK